MEGTKFPKNVLDNFNPKQNGLRILSPASNVSKLSALTHQRVSTGTLSRAKTGSIIIRKGRWKDMRLFFLSLEERRTCDHQCKLWDGCYGNHMPFANRYDHTHPRFFDALGDDLDLLAKRYSNGYVVRLHELGDFFSMEYVIWWREQSALRLPLHVFGYSHQRREIASALDAWQQAYPDRVAIMDSDGAGHSKIRPQANVEGDGVVCPYQTGKTFSCISCGLCMNGVTKVSFIKTTMGRGKWMEKH